MTKLASKSPLEKPNSQFPTDSRPTYGKNPIVYHKSYDPTSRSNYNLKDSRRSYAQETTVSNGNLYRLRKSYKSTAGQIIV